MTWNPDENGRIRGLGGAQYLERWPWAMAGVAANCHIPKYPQEVMGASQVCRDPCSGRLGEASVLRLSCHVGLHGLPARPGVPSCFLLRSLEARLLEQLTFDLPCEILRARITLSTVFGSTLFILPLYAIFVITTLIYFMKFGALRVDTVFKCLAYSS